LQIARFTTRIGGHDAPVRGGPDELDSDDLLKQGNELLKSSRALLDDLEDVVPAPEAAEDDAANQA